MNKISRLLLNIILICLSLIWAGLTNPENGSNLTYIHVLFEWEEIPEATGYELQISGSNDFSDPLVSTNTADLFYIEKEEIGWESNYYWRVRANSGDWMGPNEFSTGEALSNVVVNVFNEFNYEKGYTIFGSGNGYYSAIIDMNGREIWNSGNSNFIFYSTDHNGKYFGAQYEIMNPFPYPGIELSLTQGIIWKEPNDEYVHHEFFQLPWGDYMGIAHEYRMGPIHVNNQYRIFYLAMGKLADGITNEWRWQGDRLVIWDKNTKEVKWVWSAFDNFNMVDYDDQLWNTSPNPPPGDFYDWTHINGFFYNENDSTIYISSRNLSRITKINYPEGDIVWNMGYEMPSNEVEFGYDLEFSHQHSITVLENNNILILDNGNYSNADWFTSTPSEKPHTRALEISITEENDQLNATIEWEYILADTLFGSESGNVQKLNNGNYLITTTGDKGTSLEVTSNKELVWRADYNSVLLWRANRIDSLNLFSDNNLLSSQFKNASKFSLNAPYPNPFNPIIIIEYQTSNYSFVSGKIYDLKGRLIHTLFSGFKNQGNYLIKWDGSNSPSGVYFFVLENQTSKLTKKIMLLK